MVDVHNRHWSHDARMVRPNFNIEGSKTDVYCNQHADDGMVNVIGKRCSHDSCSKAPSFNGESSRRQPDMKVLHGAR